jgi:hypothetical protein
MKQKLKKEREAKKTVVLGFFAKEDIVDDGADAYSIDPWGQFQAAADSLRGYILDVVVVYISMKLLFHRL